MKALLDIFYYYYYLFYKKLLKDPEPHTATILALSFSESLLINGLISIVALKYYCYEIQVVFQFIVLIIIIIINSLYYIRSKKGKSIVQQRPKIIGSKSLSTIITILFFLVTLSWLFWGSIYGKYLLSKCN